MLGTLTIGKKISLGFSSVLLLLVIVGVIAGFALRRSSEGFMSYRVMAGDSNLAGRFQANLLQARFDARGYLLGNLESDLKSFEERWGVLKDLVGQTEKDAAATSDTKKIGEAVSLMAEYRQNFDKIVELQKLSIKLFNDFNAAGGRMEGALSELIRSAMGGGDNEVAGLAEKAMREMFIGRLHISRYLDTHDAGLMDRARGEFEEMRDTLASVEAKARDDSARKVLATVAQARDEYLTGMGRLVQSVAQSQKILVSLNDIGATIGKNIEAVKLDVISRQDGLGPRLQSANDRSIMLMLVVGAVALLCGMCSAFFIARGTTRDIRHVADGLAESAEQVASASGQVSSSSQQLAGGASEQAASIEETSSSLEEMHAMTRQNAENAGQANILMAKTRQTVSRAEESMRQLTHSMGEISRASIETSKIVKTIDEIAFQTNLLALNAAVEAARAGEVGAGFAVVAEEVRNLSMRAAAAAKDTENLIEGTVRKVNEGSELVERTGAEFRDVAESVGRTGDLVGEIAAASSEQAGGIEQINKAVGEMDKVVQHNAADAEETAAAAEEMDAQAGRMKELVGNLKRLVTGRDDTDAGSDSPKNSGRIGSGRASIKAIGYSRNG